MSPCRASAHARTNAPPARALTMTAPAGVMREPVRHQLGTQVTQASVAKGRLRGRSACGAFVRLPPSREPHCAGRPTWLVRRAPPVLSSTPSRCTPSSRRCRWRLGVGGWALRREQRATTSPRGDVPVLTGRRTLERGDTPRRRNAAGAIPRGESGPCDPRRWDHTGASVRLSSVALAIPTRRGVERSESLSAGRVPASRKRVPDRAGPARLRRATGASRRPGTAATGTTEMTGATETTETTGTTGATRAVSIGPRARRACWVLGVGRWALRWALEFGRWDLGFAAPDPPFALRPSPFALRPLPFALCPSPSALPFLLNAPAAPPGSPARAGPARLARRARGRRPRRSPRSSPPRC